MKKLTIFLMIFMLMFMSIPSNVFAAFTAVNIGPTTDMDGDVNIPSGKSYYINGTLLAVGDITDATDVNLSNITSVAIPVDLLSDTADTDSLGSATKEWLNLYIGDNGKIFLGIGQDIELYRSGANVLTITASGGVVITAAGLTVGGNIVSDTADTDDLGGAAAEFANIYLGTTGKFYLGLDQEVALEVTDANTLAITASSNVDFSGGLDVTAGIIVGASIVSDTADADDLGSTGAEWKEIYISDAGHLYLGSGQDTNLQRTGAGILTITAANGVVTSAGLTVTGDLLPAAASSHALGSAAAEFTDIFLDDSGYVYFGVGQDVHIQRNAANELTITASTGTTIGPMTIGGAVGMGANDLTLTGNVGRDADNFIGWGVDDSLAIEIGNVAHAIVSISDGAGDNDKLVTQGYVDDLGGVANNWVIHFMDVDAASTTYVHAAITGTGSGNDVSTAITNPDYGRIVTVTTTNNNSPSGNVTITGTLADGTTAQDDVITISAGATAVGVEAFVTVTNINIPAGVPVEDTCAIGIGDIMGLPNPISAEADIYMKTVDGVEEFGEISGNGNTTYNTLDCATIVQNEDITLYYHN